MKCIICHGDDIQVGEVREELTLKSDIVHVVVQTPVCRTCGERYYDRRTVRFLEDVERKLREGKATLHEVGRVLAYG